MATYRANITQNIEPAMANPAYLQRAAELEGRASQMRSEATAGLIKSIGGTVWDAYKGSKEAGLTADLQQEVGSLQQDMDTVKEADKQAKLAVEQEMSNLPNVLADYEQAEIASGTPPNEAKLEALKYGGEQENAILRRFREEQARVIAARDSMPERYKEFMLRSESVLKQYIASNPGLANNFRQIAQEVTGKQNLDLYSVARLYEDVNFIEKQNQAAAESKARERAQLQTAYVNDRKAGGIAETQAIREFNTFDDDTLLGLAQTSAQAAQAKTNADSALKSGGEAVKNYAVLKGIEFDNTIINKMGSVYAELAAFGVTRQQLETGSIPENLKLDPKFQDVIRRAQSQVLTALDTMYTSATAEIATYIKKNPTDSAAARQAKADLDGWYTTNKKYYGLNGEAPLLALIGGGDFTKTMQQRLTAINSISSTMQLPPDVVTSLLSTNETVRGQVNLRYPKAAAQLAYLEKLVGAATRGVPDTEWIDLLKQQDKYVNEGVNEVPTNVKESTATLLNIKQVVSTLSKKITNNEAVTQEDVVRAVSSGMATPANTDEFIRIQPTIINAAVSKLSPQDRELLTERVKGFGDQFVYGDNQHGDNAKAEFDKITRQDPLPFSRGRNVVFKDSTGLSQLSVSVNSLPQDGLTPSQRTMFSDRVRTDIKPNKLNAVLTQVDRVLKIRSDLTGEPIQRLRVEFMTTFMQEGMPSVNKTKPTAGAFNAAAQQGGQAPATSSNATDILNSFKQLGY